MGGMDVVVNTLRNGINQNPEIFKPAESQLKLWEKESGFFVMLAKITSNFSIEVNVRWLAAMYLKNAVERYWRPIVRNALPEEEKREIRQSLLENFNEPYLQVAKQLSTLISRLARMDFPKDWPELIQTLYERTKVNDALIQERSLNTLYQTICQLASKRLSNDRRAFQELTIQLFEYMLHLWSSLTNTLSSMDVRSNDFMSTLERSRLCAKILRKLIIHGFKKPCLHAEVNAYVENIFQKLKSFMELRKEHESQETMKELIEKYVTLLTKTMIDLLEHHPFSFIQFIKPSVELTLYYVFSPEGESLTFPKLVIQCFNLMKCIIACPEYGPSLSSPSSDLPETKNAIEIMRELFTPEVCVGVCEKLMSKYFILSKEELELWESDPEEFWTEAEATENVKYNLRPAVENLFTSIFRENNKILIPFLAKVVEDTNKIVDIGNIYAICQKDAIYNMIGIGAMDFFDVIDFDDWFQKTLIHELNIKDPNYRILRRRIILLVGHWVSLKFSKENRQVLYEAIIHLLSTDEDMVVRMAAASTLKCTIADFEFDIKNFLPYVASLFGLLYELLRDAKEGDTKLMVLHVMSFMIQYMGIEIKPHLGPLIQYLPPLWLESQHHNMLRCGIIGALTHLTIGLMDESVKIHSFLLSVTKQSIDVTQNSYIYLLDDGLFLWLTIVCNCPTDSAEPLLNMYENMFPIFDIGTDSVITCFDITINYIALCPQPFLSRYGKALMAALQPFMDQFSRQTDVNVRFAKVYEMILRVLPWEGAHLLRTVLPTIITIVVDKAESKYTEIYSMQIILLARVVLAAGDIFNTVVTEVAQKIRIPVEELLENILTKWWGQISLIVKEEKRKLCAMALAQLCSNNWPPVLNVWGQSMTSIAELVFDISDKDDLKDVLVYTNDFISAQSQPTADEHCRRMKAICIRDPVYSISIRQFLAVQLKAFEQNAGSVVVGNLFQTLEEDCKKLLKEITAT